MGLDRNSNSDVGRRPGGTSSGKAVGYQYVMPAAKGHWLPAYGGGMGKCAEEYDPDIGTAEEEVGNDADQDRLSGY